MKKVPTGIRVNVTNRVHGMLEQGGAVNKIVVVGWDAIPGLTPDRDLNDAYNDWYPTFGDIVRACAFGRIGDQSKVKVIRKGNIIC